MKDYIDVGVYFKDGGIKTAQTVTFKLNLTVEEEHDEDVFFYVEGKHQIDNMIQSGMDTCEDFVVTGYGN